MLTSADRAAFYLASLTGRRSERRAAVALYAGVVVVGLALGWVLAALRGRR